MLSGCLNNNNCPTLFPVCGGGGGPNLCGCSKNADCQGHDAVCSVPDHGNCFWCDGPECKIGESHIHKCALYLTLGCDSNANCPADRPVCGAVTSHRCGCSADSECSGGKICEGGVCIEGCRYSYKTWIICILNVN